MRTGRPPVRRYGLALSLLALAAVALSAGPARAQLDRVFLDPAPCEPDHFVATTFFGRTIAAYGTELLVGARSGGCEASSSDRGTVYLIDDSSGAVIRKFVSPLAGVGDFGTAVGTIGTEVIVGAPWDLGPGATYLMNGADAAFIRAFFSPGFSTNDGFGTALATVVGTVIVGAPRDDTTGLDAGRAYLYRASNGQLLGAYTNPMPGTKGFGTSIALLGTNVIISAPSTGTGGVVYLFDRLAGTVRQTFPNPSALANGFGRTVAAVGTRVLVGAPGEGPNGVGAAYLFDSTTGALIHTFTDPRPEADDAFGTAVAGLGTDALIGAPGATADREGAVYRFDANPVSPTFRALRQVLLKAHLTVKPKPDNFGASIGVIGNNPVIGAPGYPSAPTVAPGAVYLFDECGNGTIGAAEQCDDANTVAGDGCNFCALELCPSTPVLGCRRAPAGRSTIVMQRPEPPAHANDKLVFRWKGPATSGADFGMPRTTTNYQLCIYDGSVLLQPLIRAAAPAGGTCLERPCWQQSGPVIVKYKDRLRGPSGLLSILLRPGTVDGTPFLRFRGRGGSLMLPTMPLTTNVVVQVKNSETDVCWESVYGGDVRANTDKLFRASSD